MSVNNDNDDTDNGNSNRSNINNIGNTAATPSRRFDTGTTSTATLLREIVMESTETMLRRHALERTGSSGPEGERPVDDVMMRTKFKGNNESYGNANPAESVSPEALLNGQTNIDKKLITPVIKNNQFQVRKSAARALMDAALMMANISQMRTLLELGADNVSHFHLVLSLTILSLVMQITFAILMFLLLMKESEMAKKKDYLEHLQLLESAGGIDKETVANLKTAITNRKEDFEHELYMTRLNYSTIFLVFVITVVNMFITGFGVRTKETGSVQQ